jgi:hypothetical protein
MRSSVARYFQDRSKTTNVPSNSRGLSAFVVRVANRTRCGAHSKEKREAVPQRCNDERWLPDSWSEIVYIGSSQLMTWITSPGRGAAPSGPRSLFKLFEIERAGSASARVTAS